MIIEIIYLTIALTLTLILLMKSLKLPIASIQASYLFISFSIVILFNQLTTLFPSISYLHPVSDSLKTILYIFLILLIRKTFIKK